MTKALHLVLTWLRAQSSNASALPSSVSRTTRNAGGRGWFVSVVSLAASLQHGWGGWSCEGRRMHGPAEAVLRQTNWAETALRQWILGYACS